MQNVTKIHHSVIYQRYFSKFSTLCIEFVNIFTGCFPHYWLRNNLEYVCGYVLTELYRMVRSKFSVAGSNFCGLFHDPQKNVTADIFSAIIYSTIEIVYKRQLLDVM